MFTQSDVIDMFATLKDAVNKNIDTELTYYLNMNGNYTPSYMQPFLSSCCFMTLKTRVCNCQLKLLKSKICNNPFHSRQNIQEMNDFVKNIAGSSLPSDFNKTNAVSKLGSISKTQDLINDHEQLKHEFDLLKQELNILKSQNQMLATENDNLNTSGKQHISELDSLRQKMKVQWS